MTSAVWQGFKKAKPNSDIVLKKMFRKIDVRVSGYTGEVYGGSVTFRGLR